MKGETTSAPDAARRSGLSAVGELVRRHDRDRFQTALFAPAPSREALLVLYAFNYEIARVREIVSEPMLGQIRLQWWREVVDVAYRGGAPRQHVVAGPLTEVIRAHGLSRAAFDRMIDAREADVSDAAPADLAALEDYARGTSSALVELALQALGVPGGVPGEAACHAARPVGIAYALAGLLRAMPFHARAGRCYIPRAIAERTGLDLRDYAALRSSPSLRAAVAEIAAAARAQLRAGRALRAAIPRQGLAAMLPAVIAERFLRRLQRAGNDPFAASLARPDPLQVWHLALAALRNRY